MVPASRFPNIGAELSSRPACVLLCEDIGKVSRALIKPEFRTLSYCAAYIIFLRQARLPLRPMRRSLLWHDRRPAFPVPRSLH